MKFKRKSKRKSKRFTIQDRFDDLLACHQEERDVLNSRQQQELHNLWVEAYQINRNDPVTVEIWRAYAGDDQPMPSVSFREW